MPGELPIACSLNATELPERLAEMAALGGAALVDAHTQPLHAELRFATGEGVRERVEAIVAAESRCCSFLTMGVSDEPDLVVLNIDAPEGAELVLDEIVAAFLNQSQAT
jgi:hypothetical protein